MDKEIMLSTIEDALADFKEGKFVIVVDDEDRENEGDFITAAELITEEKVNFMLKNGRGVLCAPITITRAEELELERQVQTNTSMLGTPFTVTVDLLDGCTTGVSIHALYRHLSDIYGEEVRPTASLFDGLENADFFVTVSGLVKEVATLLSKITRDLRLMRSGPRSGFMEVRLPP